MSFSSGLAFSLTVLVEMIVLLNVWNWSVQRKMVLALLGAGILILVPVAASFIYQESVPAQGYLAFAGMYIFSGLIWRWWKDDIALDDWNVGEGALALLGTLMFSRAIVAFV